MPRRDPVRERRADENLILARVGGALDLLDEGRAARDPERAIEVYEELAGVLKDAVRACGRISYRARQQLIAGKRAA